MGDAEYLHAIRQRAHLAQGVFSGPRYEGGFEAGRTLVFEDVPALLSEIEQLRTKSSTDDEEIAALKRIVIDRNAALKIAHGGLRRALDYRAATPEGLAIKADIRETLIASGDPGPWGVVGSG